MCTKTLSQAGSCLCLRWQPQPFPIQAGCLGKAVTGSGSGSGGVTGMCQISSCSSGPCSCVSSYSMSCQVSCLCHCSKYHRALQGGMLPQSAQMIPRGKVCNITSKKKLKSLKRSKSPPSPNSGALPGSERQCTNMTGMGLASEDQCPICHPC